METTEAKKILQIPEELDNLRNGLAMLDDIVATLEKRLQSVLREDCPSAVNPSAVNQKEMDKNRVPLASDIDILVCRLKESNKYLKNILFRLEV